MPKTTFMPQNITVEISANTLLSEAARIAGISMETPCGGVGVCGKCKVKVSPVTSVVMSPNEHLGEKEVKDGYVLACHTRVVADVTVFLPEHGEMKVLEEGTYTDIPLNPAVKVEGETLGLAIDVGTTTLAVTLVDLVSGEELATETGLNPQTALSSDVIGRIMAAEKKGKEKLHQMLWDTLDDMTQKLLVSTRKEASSVKEAVVCANTVMQHIAQNISPSSLGRFPYTPETWGHEKAPSPLRGKSMAEESVCYYPAIIAGYVGSDITAGILSTGMSESDKTILFVDIGTNGEMVLQKDGKLYAASTAAGPAFEGGNIQFGMRAESGAIESAEKTPYGYSYKTIDDAPARGICGSGLFDMVSCLVHEGIIDETGFLDSFDEDGEGMFPMIGGIYLTAQDVRQVQLAKGAIRAGIQALLEEVSIQSTDVDEVYIGGAFGYHLKEESLLRIGLLPKAFEGKIRYVGNTARSGAVMMLKNAPVREKMSEIAHSVQSVDLASRSDFSMLFTEAMMFTEE